MIFAFKVFLLPSLRWISIEWMWITWLIYMANGFFQSPFKANEMFCLPNKFVLFTNHKQPLKWVWQNSYLGLWSNTLYIIWQGVHLLVKLQARGTNKLLTKWNLLQAFMIHFTLYLYLSWSLYLWWWVSRLIYIFPKVPNLDEESLGKIVLVSFLLKCK